MLMKKSYKYSMIRFSCDLTKGNFTILKDWDENFKDFKLTQKDSNQIKGIIILKEKRYKQKRRYAKNLKRTWFKDHVLFVSS